MAALTNYLEDKIIDHLMRGTAFTAPVTLHVGLFTAIPGEAGGGTEVTGGNYARASITSGVGTWNATGGADGTTENTAVVNFNVPSASWGLVQWFGVFDAPTAGNLLFYAALGVAKTINSGDTVSFAAGALSLQIDN